MHYYDPGAMLEGTCLLCYASGVRTLDIVNTPLQGIFEKLVECKIKHATHQLCFVCHRRLQHCNRFCQMAKKAHFLIDVFNMVDPTLEVTTENYQPPLVIERVINISLPPSDMQPPPAEKPAETDDDDDYARLVIDVDAVNCIKVENEYYSDISSASEDFTAKDLSKTKENNAQNKDDRAFLENHGYDFTRQILYTNLDTFDTFGADQQVLQNTDINFNETLNEKAGEYMKNSITIYPIMPDENTGVNQACDKFTCQVCAIRFNSETYLRQHQKKAHSDERPFRCDICKRTFQYNSYLKVHKKQHYPDKPFCCEVCQHRFRYKSNLNAHLRTHTANNTFKCEYCQAKFTRKFLLIQHRSKHTGEKPFACNMCDRKYTNKQNLRAHRRSYGHDKEFCCEVSKENFKRISNDYAFSNAPEKPFTCPVCEKKFTRKFGLKMHARMHVNDKPFICGICKCSFTNFLTFCGHTKTHEVNMLKPILTQYITNAIPCCDRAKEIHREEITRRLNDENYIPNNAFL